MLSEAAIDEPTMLGPGKPTHLIEPGGNGLTWRRVGKEGGRLTDQHIRVLGVFGDIGLYRSDPYD